MSNITLGILLLVAGNFFASLSDVAVKLLNGEVPPLQYIFFRQLLSLLLITPLWLKQNKVQRQLKQAKITFARGQLILIGSGCMVVAITHLPLATANAVFYVAPLLMLPLSILLLDERPAMGESHRYHNRFYRCADRSQTIAISLGGSICAWYGMYPSAVQCLGSQAPE